MQRTPRHSRVWHAALAALASGALLLGSAGAGFAADDEGHTPPPFSFSSFTTLDRGSGPIHRNANFEVNVGQECVKREA